MTTVEDVYTATLTPPKLTDEQTSLLIGVQGQLWSEYTPTAAQVEYMAFPRMCALAERAWGSPAQSWEEFEERLRGHLPDSTPSASATARWTDMPSSHHDAHPTDGRPTTFDAATSARAGHAACARRSWRSSRWSRSSSWGSARTPWESSVHRSRNPA
ncbi:family 20 glycosylhydrolase [Brachybacterium sacelli]|uniref:family 20 glycosylhydrolase n=1 Tax=Brachybacterium sacelli TaxID=173364 RepID=UPI00360D9402